ncbi:MAG: VWA domain-containing protein [Acidobacteria bacterium]|nr:VWA domain-containing protein [Acidobacteriota bacterium]
MKDLVFADRELLWVLVPLFLAWAALWWWRSAHHASGTVRFSAIATLQRLRVSRTLFWRRMILALRLLTVALLLIAAIRPQTGRKQTQVSTEGIDIMLVVDTSGSMQALDLDSERQISRRRNRLAVAQAVVEDFITKRPNDQIGLVVFGAEAFTQCPLTLDHGIVSTFLDRLQIGMAGDATAIGSAIGTAVKRLRDSSAKSKVIILLTDGRSNAGALSPHKAAEIAKTFGVKVYTIGAGTRGKAPFIVDSFFGKQVVYEDVEIDEGSLRDIAEVTGGAYFRAEDEQGLEAIYDKIDQLEKTEITTDTYMEYNERFRWLVFPALGLLLFEVLLLGTRFRKLP